MRQRHVATTSVRISAIAVTALAFWIVVARAEMGSCLPDAHASFVCGTGDGAARVIADTLSPSKRLALAWRVPDASPIHPPNKDDDIESLIVRTADGAIIARTSGAYWNTGQIQVRDRYVFAVWSPDSSLLIREAGGFHAIETAEVFAFDANDAVIGSNDLQKTFEPAVRAQMKDVKDAADYSLTISLTGSFTPSLTIDNQGLVKASVIMKQPESGDARVYDVTAQVTRGTKSLDATVVSVAPFRGPHILVIRH